MLAGKIFFVNLSFEIKNLKNRHEKEMKMLKESQNDEKSEAEKLRRENEIQNAQIDASQRAGKQPIGNNICSDQTQRRR